MRVNSFDPISDAASRVLILGSMPGKVSLRAGQYYAHPRNAFWRILGGLLGFDPRAPYEARISSLRAHRVALWDVMRSCVRATSLDSDIEESSIVSNPFPAFLREHPKIHTICFNGAKAEQAWRRHVLPRLPSADGIAYHRLPSTSPANASIGYDEKVEAWRVLRRCLRRAGERERATTPRSSRVRARR